jgi:hypothetical protein
MAIADPGAEGQRVTGVGSGDDGGAVSFPIDTDWRASDLAALLGALEQVYDVFRALEVDAQTGGRDLGLIAPRLGQLAPESQLEIVSMYFASAGVISLQGSGEPLREVRKLVTDLATIGQLRAANKLDLELKKQEIAERQAAQANDEAMSEIQRDRQVEQNRIELAQMRQQVMRTDIELAGQYLSLIRQRFEDQYGPDWRSVPGTQEQFELLASGGGELLAQISAGHIAPPELDGSGDREVRRARIRRYKID